MRTFDKLTEDEQAWAERQTLEALLRAILEGDLRFNDELSGDGLQAAIDAVGEEAERMQTPWFAHEYIMEARYRPSDGHVTDNDGLWGAGEALRSIAHADAEDAIYADADDPPVVRLPREGVEANAS